MGDLPPELPAEPTPSLAPASRIRVGFALVLWLGILFVLLAGAAKLLFFTFSVRRSLEDTAFYMLGAAALFALPGMFAARLLHNRRTTGLWLPDRERTLRRLALIRSRPQGWRQASPWSWIRAVLLWSGHIAFQSSQPLWKRALGWLLLAFCAVFLLLITRVSIVLIFIGIRADDTAGSVLVVFGAALLLWPAFVARALFLRLRSGRLPVSAEEMQAVHRQRSAWRKRESQRPLRTKIVSAIFLVAVYALWWLRVTLHHAQHPHESRLTPALWTPFVLYTLWAQFSKPKKAESGQQQAPPAHSVLTTDN